MKKKVLKKDQKKGVSKVLAEILLILMVIIAVALLWYLLRFYLDLKFYYSDLTILESGFTTYNPLEQIAMVQIKRGVDNSELAGLEVIFSVGGNSYVYETPPIEMNEKKVYYFNLCKDGIGVPEKISVAPVFLHKKRKLGGDVISWSSKFLVKEFSVKPFMYEDSFNNKLRKSKYTSPEFPQFLKTDVTSHWKFNHNALDDLEINNAHAFGESTSYTEGAVGCGRSIDFGDGGFVINDNPFPLPPGRITDNLNIYSDRPIDNKINQDGGTISVWFKRDGFNSHGGRNYILSISNWSCHFVFDSPCDSEVEDPINRIYLYFRGNNNFLGYSFGSNFYNDKIEIPLDKWSFATISWQADSPGSTNGTAKLYINGTLISSENYVNLTIPNHIRWGGWPDLPGEGQSGTSSKTYNDPDTKDYLVWQPIDILMNFHETERTLIKEYFNGSLDEARIFNRTLTDDEVKMLYDFENYLIVN